MKSINIIQSAPESNISDNVDRYIEKKSGLHETRYTFFVE